MNPARALPPDESERLAGIARRLRVDIIEMLCKAGSGHPGGSLSSADILTALYFRVMRHDAKRLDDPERDRFVLSKGHGVPALYAALAEAGYITHAELATLRRIDSRLQGHPANRLLPFAEASTGSLGQGLSVAQGMAIAAKLDGKKSRVFCLIGDGETQEGQIWEAAMSAPKYRLDNLIAITDYNKVQLAGKVPEVMDLEPLVEKWRAFNWNAVEIDGHDMAAVVAALEEAAGRKNGKPSMIVAHTVKGKGVSFMEGDVGWHGVAPNRDQADKAVAEILGGRQ